jgi:hypothetical protein
MQGRPRARCRTAPGFGNRVACQAHVSDENGSLVRRSPGYVAFVCRARQSMRQGIMRHHCGVIVITRAIGFADGPMKAAIITVGIVVALTIPAHAIECQLSKGVHGYHWAWREIDGRRCWYEGEHGTAKSTLHWPAQSHAAQPRSTGPSIPLPTSADLALSPTEPSLPDQTPLSYWKRAPRAPLPYANTSFDARWSAWQGNPNVRQLEADFPR